MSDVTEGVAFPLMTLRTQLKEIVVFQPYSAGHKGERPGHARQRSRDGVKLGASAEVAALMFDQSGRFLSIEAELPSFEPEHANELESSVGSNLGAPPSLLPSVSEFTSVYEDDADQDDLWNNSTREGLPSLVDNELVPTLFVCQEGKQDEAEPPLIVSL
jgi:hypothetical protein